MNTAAKMWRRIGVREEMAWQKTPHPALSLASHRLKYRGEGEKGGVVLAKALSWMLLVVVVAAGWGVLAGGVAMAQGAAGEAYSVLVDPENSFNFTLLRGEKTIGQLNIVGWGPNWGWLGFSSKDRPKGDDYRVSTPFTVNKANGQIIQLALRVAKAGPRAVAFTYDLSAEKDVPLTMLVAALGIDKSQTGQLTADVEGKPVTQKLPIGRGALGPVSKAVFATKDFGEIVATMQPAVPIGLDGDARIMLAEQQFAAGKKTVTVTLSFPAEVALLVAQADIDKLTKSVAGPDWFTFNSANDNSASVISMNSWLEQPAGKRGGVRMVGDKFQFVDGSPVKFWGSNLSYGRACAPEKKVSDFTAARFAKYGVNAVRLHKFSYPRNHSGIGDANDSTKMEPAGLDRLDYFADQLKKNGVYYGWSHTFGFYVRPGDKAKLAAYDEIIRAYPQGNTYALINFAEDVQDLMIQMVANLLKHQNPYTGMTYANDPALCFIEMQNEDDIFFYTSEKAFAACPTYKKLFMQQFAGWLKDKYQSEASLAAAWADALKSGETIAAASIVPQTNPWFFGDNRLPQLKGGERQRSLDTAAFLHEAQNKFYGKFLKAIRDAGYQGPVNGSPWQAPSMLPHYYNLRSDYLAGYIDRHNYFGGGLSDTMLSQPGSGYFSTGMQQVIDRPFGLSEWIHVYPSLYSAEGPAIIAAYGMGLQGWDASYEFQSQAVSRSFGEIAGRFPWGVWEADTPTQQGQFPALARMVMRGDVKESPVISTRNVSPPELAMGTFSFADKVSQQGDIKTFGGSVPPEAMAAGRVVVQFTDQSKPSTFPDMGKYQQGKVITSATGQLVWDYSDRGFFTVNTDGTKAVVGFAQGKEAKLGDVAIKLDSDYASIFLTAMDRQATLANGKTALLTAVARSSNTGFKFFAATKKVLDNGKAPIVMEPVKATVTISGRTISAVNVLDHDGKRTGRTLSLRGGQFTIDSAADKTIYYEVVFQ